MANPTKEKKNKEGREDGNGLIRRVLEEIAVLRDEVATIKTDQSKKIERFAGKEGLFIKGDEGTDLTSASITQVMTGVDDVVVARLAYAFASAQKVKIVRILLQEGPLSSAQIGERTGLTTGSLYHHLRELSHADVIEPAGRNLHTITPLGRKATLALFQLAR